MATFATSMSGALINTYVDVLLIGNFFHTSYEIKVKI
jgi:hypothetical protein